MQWFCNSYPKKKDPLTLVFSSDDCSTSLLHFTEKSWKICLESLSLFSCLPGSFFYCYSVWAFCLRNHSVETAFIEVSSEQIQRSCHSCYLTGLVRGIHPQSGLFSLGKYSFLDSGDMAYSAKFPPASLALCQSPLPFRLISKCESFLGVGAGSPFLSLSFSLWSPEVPCRSLYDFSTSWKTLSSQRLKATGFSSWSQDSRENRSAPPF